MIFSYSVPVLTLKQRGLMIALGVVALPLTMQPQKPETPSDPRVTKLHGFLRKLDCPVAGLAPDFVRVADQNKLDWRLLPSIAVIESGGGKAYRNNNIFGWNGGNQRFTSIRTGLELVGSRLAQSPLYRRHDSFGKLRIYNEDQAYAHAVLAVMNRMGAPESNRN